ncbi:MAG TPA: M1 family aminopeptidase, partial [Planctomycetota bacterium]|nr:M1 family aminopeptidase [Planctomycetota bacterium]
MYLRAAALAVLLLPVRPAAAEEPVPVPSGSPAVTAHVLSVSLDPAKGTLEATDRMAVRRNRGGSVLLDLHAGLEIRLLEVDGRILPAVTREESDPLPGTARYRIAINPHPGDTAAVVLSYGGVIREEVRKSGDLAFVAGDRLSGTIGPDGVFLSEASGWVPRDGSMATYAVTASVPEGWTLASQGGVPVYTDEGGKSIVTFPAGVPADGLWLQAGRWKVERRTEKGGVSLGTYLSEANAAHSKVLLDAVEEYLAFYRDVLGPYPHAKFDIVENFFTTGYGMPAATLLGGDVIAHMAAMAGRSGGKIPAGYLDHELVHCWWGNGVAVDYASGNWCEGLTTYLANYLRKEKESAEEAARHRRGARARFAARVRPDRDYPLRQFQGKTEDFENDIGYGKASMLCHMARRAVGDEAFFGGLRDFAREYMGKRAGWDELRKCLEARGQRNLDGLFGPMLERTGAPVLALRDCGVEAIEGGWRVYGSVHQAGEHAWPVAVPIVVETTGGLETATVDSVDARTDFTVKTKDLPLRVLLDPDSHCWRGFLPGEVPATLDATLNDPSGFKWHAPAPEAVPEGLKPVIEGLRSRPGSQPISDRDRGDADGFWSRIYVGTFAELIDPDRPYWPVTLDGAAVRVGGRKFEGDDVAVLASIRGAGGRAHTLFAGTTLDALAAARRVFFYGGDGVVVFKAGRPVLRLEAEGDESSRATLLANVFPEPDAARAGALVDALCEPSLEGRLAGATGDGAAREVLLKALRALGIEPIVQAVAFDIASWDGETSCLGIGEGEPAPAKGVPFLFSPPSEEWSVPAVLTVAADATPESFLASLNEALGQKPKAVLVLGPPEPPKALVDYLLLPPKHEKPAAGEAAKGPKPPAAMTESARRARLLLPEF